MKLSKKYTTPTSFSKTLALALFITIPMLTFYIGTQLHVNNIEPVLNGQSEDSLQKILTREFPIGSKQYKLINKYTYATRTAQIILSSVSDNTEYALGDGFYGHPIISLARSQDSTQFLIAYGVGDGEVFKLMKVIPSQDKKTLTVVPAQDLKLIPEVNDEKKRSEQILTWTDADHILMRETTTSASGQTESVKYWLVSVKNPTSRKEVNL